MRWTTKSMIQRLCAHMPGGQSLYFLLQTRLGSLRNPDYLSRLKTQKEMAIHLAEHEVVIKGAEVLEVGTGWIPLIPIGFWICGAKRLRTYDLHAYLSKNLLRDALVWMSRNRQSLVELWGGLVPRSALNEKLDVIASLANHPMEFLKEANIEYSAPADAAGTGLASCSIDIHYSAHVLEHVPPEVLFGILVEAHRILRPGAVAIHSIDPTDHFAHADPTITNINFLRFEVAEWKKYSDNQFAYHNRLRSCDYERIFADSPLRLVEYRFETDGQALKTLKDGFPLATPFRGYSSADLCRTNLRFLALRE